MKFHSSDVSAASQRTWSTPGVRAVAGGVLVACAALGVLVAPSGAEAPDQRYLVLTRSVTAGDSIDEATVQSLAMDLPPTVATGAMQALGGNGDGTGESDLIARAAMPAGALLHVDQLRRTPARNATGAELTVALPRSRALGGELRTGDIVDLVATYGSGTDGFTAIVGIDTVLTQVAPADSGLGLEPGLTLGLRLAPDSDPLAVVHAVRADALSLIRPADGGSDDLGAFVPDPTGTGGS